jgi:hypothetical protein
MNPYNLQSAILQFTILVLSGLLCGCGRTYTQEEMVGVYKSDGSPAFTLHLNADGTSLTDYGDGGRFSGKWHRVSTDGISTVYNESPFNVNPTFYTILSKDTLKPLLSEDALKMGVNAPLFNRVK